GANTAPAGGANPQGLPEGHPSVDTAAVVKQMGEMAAKNPKDSEVRLKLANFLYDQKQYAQSIEWYHQALEIDPKDVNARTDLGTAYFYSGHPHEALAEYRKALEIDPKHEATLMNSIVVNMDGTHDLAAAQKAWDQLNKVNPSNSNLAGLKTKIDAARSTPGAGSPR